MTTPPEIAQLRERIAHLERGGLSPADPSPALATHPDLAATLRLRAGSAYQVDSASLALLLMSGPSRAGAWCGLVGVDDFGAEAAAGLGVELSRTIVVPEPGEQWLEATAALVDVATLVVLRPPSLRAGSRVAPSVAERIGARLRERSAALVVWGEWPRCAARLRLTDVAWAGPGRGEGLLRSRRAVVEVRRGSGAPVRVSLGGPLPGRDPGVLTGTSLRPLTAVQEAG